jgi:hypothetical protein
MFKQQPAKACTSFRTASSLDGGERVSNHRQFGGYVVARSQIAARPDDAKDTNSEGHPAWYPYDHCPL